jgi:6-phosphogluconolactonase (cycloisomerase 2 family)
MKALSCAFWAFILIVIAGCGGSSTAPQIDLVYAAGQGQNAIQGFSLRQDGTLQALTVSSFGTNPRPVALAFTPAKTFVYVANDTSNTVSGFSVDHTSGVLTPVGTAVPPTPICPATLPPTVTCSTPINVGVSSNGQFLFSLNQGSSNISVFNIDARGLLSPVAGSPFPAPANPQFMAVSPNANFVYVSAANTIVTLPFSTSGVIGAAASTFTSPTAGATIKGTAIDNKGQFLYATDSTNNQLLSLSVQSSGVLSLVGPPSATGTTPVNAAVDFTGNFVYSSNQGSNDVSAFKANAGVLTAVSGSPFITAATGATGVALTTAPGYLTTDTTNGFLLVSNTGTRSITVFGIDPTNGSLVQAPNSPFGQAFAPDWILVSN